jgi:hypothetical protein
MGNLAGLHDNMGHLDLALALYRDALQRKRRVLGNRHQLTLYTMADMGVSLCSGRVSLCLGNDTAARAGIALLEEAVAGRTAVLGADHPDTRQSQQDLNWAKSRESEQREEDERSNADDDDDEEVEEEEEEETIADRICKRRRRA